MFQALFIKLFVKPHEPCRSAWSEAGLTRRMLVQLWALAWVRTAGSVSNDPNVMLSANEMFPGGVENASRDEIKSLQALYGEWLDYWSARNPQASLEEAMFELLGRLFASKRGWMAERQEPFPFRVVLARVKRWEFEGEHYARMHKMSQLINIWLGASDEMRHDMFKAALYELVIELACSGRPDMMLGFFGISDDETLSQDGWGNVLYLTIVQFLDFYASENPTATISDACKALIAMRRARSPWARPH